MTDLFGTTECHRARAGLLVVTVCLLAVGCETREIGEKREELEPGERELVFSDDFEREAVGGNWYRGSGENGSGDWEIEDGWLTASDIKNDPLWLDQPLPENVRIEFDAVAKSAEGDLKVEMFGDGETHESGYIVIMGGWSNKLDVIARLDEHGDDRKEKPTMNVEPNRVYRWALERTDGELRWYVDGELNMRYDDDQPLEGQGHRHFAFNDWTAPVKFDNVRVYRIGEQ